MRFTSNRDIAVSVRNLEKSRLFYEKTLGLIAEHIEEKLVVYNTGYFTLYVQEGDPHPPVPSFTVSNIKEAKKHLKNSGCTIVEERDTSLYFKDLDGITWDAIQG